MKDKKNLPYPDPKDDVETKNRKMRDLRAVNSQGKRPLDIREVGNSVDEWNRRVNNEARRSFQRTEKIREQVEFIQSLPNLKRRKEAAVRGAIRRLTSKPFRRWTPEEIAEYDKLSPKLKEHIMRIQDKGK